jgi:5-methylcytosine-specific restriction endonuclease McrA
VAAWLARFTRCTDAAARGARAAAHRLSRHPHIEPALAAGAISASYGRWITDVLAKFPAEHRDAVEEILVKAAADGALLEDLVTIASAALRRLCPGGLERDEEQRHAERGLTLSKTLDGVGRLNADLTKDATALAEQVIEALAIKTGPEDTRTVRQRRHDAFAEAMRRLAGSDLLPARGGTKPQVRLTMDLATLRRLPGGRQAEQEWIRAKEIELARRQAAGTGSVHDLLTDQTATPPEQPAGPEENRRNRRDNRTDSGRPADIQEGLSGDAQAGVPDGDQAVLPGLGEGATLTGVGPISDGLAAALACDSALGPTVVASVDRDALEAMTDEWLRAHGHGDCCTGTHTADASRASVSRADASRADASRAGADGGRGAGHGDACCAGSGCGHRHHRGVTTQARDRLRDSLLRWAVQVLSGPGGLASYLRTGLLDGSLGTPSIVLDAGIDERTVPAPLERLVRRRDQHCRFPGCHHAAELSQVHHLIPRSRNGPTSLSNLLTLCQFHHLIAVHTWGWTIQLKSDGTTTATGPDGRILHEHDPPGDQAQLAA